LLCRHRVLHEHTSHRRGGRNKGTPSWRITEGQDGSLCWVSVKTRPSPPVLPPKSGQPEPQTTPSGFAVHPSIEGNELQNSSKAKPLTRGASRRKLSGVQGAAGFDTTAYGGHSANGGILWRYGSTGRMVTRRRWLSGPPPGIQWWRVVSKPPGMRVLGPQGFTGASGYAPVERPSTESTTIMSLDTVKSRPPAGWQRGVRGENPGEGVAKDPATWPTIVRARHACAFGAPPEFKRVRRAPTEQQ